MSMGADPDIENRALVDSDEEDDSASDDEEEKMELGSKTRQGSDNTSLIDQRRVANESRYLRGFTPRMLARSSLPVS